MQTTWTVALIVTFTIGWELVKDGYNQILGYQKIPESDPILENEHAFECPVAEYPKSYAKLEENYTKLKKDYSFLQNYVSKLQNDSAVFHKTLKEHKQQINKTSMLLGTIGGEVTDFKGRLEQQLKETHRVQGNMTRTILRQTRRVQRNMDRTILRQTCKVQRNMNRTILQQTRRVQRNMDRTILRQTCRVQRNMDRTILGQTSEEIWQYLWILLAIGEFVLMVYMFKLKSGHRGRQPLPPGHRGRQPLPPGHRGRQPLSPGQLSETVTTPHRDGHVDQPRSVSERGCKTANDKAVCIISFNGDPAHQKHVELSRSFLDKKVKVTDVVIQREEDIGNIPPSKVVLVHVDFDGSYILENPEREIGELRRTTVLALWRMKADVILFYYYEEQNAKPLDDQDLYSPDLVSISTQTELKRLEQQKKFFNVSNGQLSERQRQHLDELVQKTLG